MPLTGSLPALFIRKSEGLLIAGLGAGSPVRAVGGAEGLNGGEGGGAEAAAPEYEDFLRWSSTSADLASSWGLAFSWWRSRWSAQHEDFDYRAVHQKAYARGPRSRARHARATSAELVPGALH
jgi:hypothetical protein